MRRRVRYLLIPVLVALLMTGSTYLVTERVSGYLVGGFPFPYATSHPSGDELYGSMHIYSVPNLIADLEAWTAIALAVAATFTSRRFLAAAGVGGGVTLFTLLLQPPSVIYPFGGAETSLRPMGFPYEYLTHYATIGIGTVPSSGYYFMLSAALADYALWTGIALAFLGIALTIGQRPNYELIFETSPGP